MTPNKQVSSVIRISQRKRDASARATHLEAATRKFLVTTNERKQMSTKTNFKRIALVAVAALGLGVLSSVPVIAAVSGLTVTVANGTATLTKSDSTTAATFNITGLVEAGDSVTAYVVTKSIPSSGGAILLHNLDSATPGLTSAYRIDTLAANTTGGNVVKAGNAADSMTVLSTSPAASQVRISLMAATANINHNFGVQLDSSTPTTRIAGTYTYTLVVKSYAAGSANSALGTVQPNETIVKEFTITVAASATTIAAAVTTISPSLSTAFIGTSSTLNEADATITSVSTASATPAAYISTRTYNVSAVEKPESVTATITGAGILAFGSVSGTSITINGDGSDQIEVRPDGRNGVAVITVSTPTRTFAAKNVTFYSTAAKTITASVFNPTLTLGSNSTAIAAVAVDSGGVTWAGQAYIVASTAADALVGGSATTPVACSYEAVADTKTHFCPVSTIATGTAKFKIIDAATVALATATSNEVTVTVANNPVASVKLAFNKPTYQAGEKAYITVTALDSAGKTLQGQTFANLLTSGGITTSYAFGNGSDTLTFVSIATSVSNSATTPSTAGAKTYTVYMPTTGSVKITATGGASVALSGQVEVSATATVIDASAAATAAASAALAAVTALATTVASLKTLITTLTNLVLKIQKKVKA